MRKLRFPSMIAGMVMGVASVVVFACAGGAYLFSLHHSESLLQTARQNALAQGELMRVALEHQMIENDRTLIGRMIESFSKQPKVERVVILDRMGVSRFAGGKQNLEALDLNSSTCQACHQHRPEQRGSSRIIETAGGSKLRTVIPIPNRVECHGCHDAGIRLNGVLLLDYDVGETQAAMANDLHWMVGASGAIAFLLIGSIGLVIRSSILKRLQRFETVARQIASGDLNRRIPAKGNDTLAWLGREFNTMADSMTGLVREVRSQGERLETIINSIDDGIIVLDAQRNILAANEAFLKRSGQSRDLIFGEGCQAGEGGCAVHDCPAHACLAKGERQVRICQRVTADGKVAWEEVHASPIRDASGKLTQVVEVWRDISDRREAEARLSESHRLASLGMLASGFSHELNTPLATVLLCVEGILRDIPADQHEAGMERIRESASIAREQVLRCRGTTQHFLRLSRGTGSTGVVIALEPTLDAVTRLVAPTARAHRVQVELEEVPEGLQVLVDEADLQHALVNLLLNAIQASQPGGAVTISASSGPGVHIRVADDGCGISPEFIKQIFEPFFSVRKGGTGLGLFLSLQFVRRWGGDIRVESSPGLGSAFEISLPMLSGCEEAKVGNENFHIHPASR